MEDFPKYYKILFNAMTDALRAMEAHNYGTAAACLRRGQVESEAAFLKDTDGFEDPEADDLEIRGLIPLFDDSETEFDPDNSLL